MKSYNTKEVTKEIADWLNLPENSVLFNIRELSRRIGFNDKTLSEIMLGRRLSINPEFIDKVINIISPFGFKSLHWKIDFQCILTKSSIYFNIKKSDIVSCSRRGELPKIRKFLMKAGAEKLKLTRSVIGENLGGKNHSSVSTGIKILNGWIESNTVISNQYNDFIEKLELY